MNSIIIEKIKTIIFNFIEEEYKLYLKNNNILLIKENNIENIINFLYENNTKNIKIKIREDLKNEYNDDYPNALIENVILDIFQDKTFNINKLIHEINFIQNKNLFIIEQFPIINNSLNLNISIIDNYIIINSVNIKNISEHLDLYNTINQFKFIYAINDLILEEINNEDKINIIKQEILNKNFVKLYLYYKKIDN